MIRKRQKKIVFVAMSGGVDSAVSAGLLKKQGYQVIGITMCFNIPDRSDKHLSCCGQTAIEEAQRVAQKLEIPHYVLNFEKELNQYVVDDFIKEYQAGRTPNPCVRCNQYIKFDILLRKVKALGADFLATGHYARIQYSRIRRQWFLKKGKDQKKDQSYFLYRIQNKDLPNLVFPIGHLTKSQVRTIAKAWGLRNSDRKESQDVCFIPRGDYSEFMSERLGPTAVTPGPICDATGKVLGRHHGIARYTIGQREGLGIALGKPMYIYKIDSQKNTIYVGDRRCLMVDACLVESPHWIAENFLKKKMEVKIKIRYNQVEARAWISQCGRDCIRVDFPTPQKAVTPGQSAVFYHGERVLGGGLIQQIV